jgi:membrane protease YdiL (CAAX protease family)
LLLSVLIILPALFLSNYLLSHLTWLPDVMEQQFDAILSYPFGILLITIIGPVFEEILFRGIITAALLRHYTPVKAIILSAFIFGIIHGNPVQMVGAGLIGLLLAWIYYRTGSLIPVIIIHIINNGLSVFLGKIYPDMEYLPDIMNEDVYYTLLVLSILLLTGACWGMKRATVPPSYQQEQITD